MKHNWEYKRLEDVCDKGSSNLVQKNLEFSEDGYDVYGASGLIGKIKSYHQEKPYIGIVKDGSGVGRVCLYPAKTSLIGTMQYIFANQKVHTEYLIYVLKSLNLAKYSLGAAIPHIYFRDYKKEIVPVPPREVQGQIVAELDAINEGIAEMKEQVADLDRLAQSLFYETFGDPISNPKAWPVKKLGEVGTIVGGSTPKTDKDEFWNGKLLWITPAELKGPKYIYETERHITEEGRKSAGLQLLPENTVLLTSRAPIGKVAIAKHPMYCNQGFKNIIFNKNLIHHEYLYLLLILMNDVLQEKGKGPTFKEISKSVTENITVPLPPLALQQQFAEQIEAIEAMKAKLATQIADAQTLLDSRMDYWFN